MDKKKKHEKAEAFRQEICSVGKRNVVLSALSSKQSFDESDELKISVLFQKASYIAGCEGGYVDLINRIHRCGNEKMIAKTVSFAKKLGHK